jgi:serine/threonine-protein kinase
LFFKRLVSAANCRSVNYFNLARRAADFRPVLSISLEDILNLSGGTYTLTLSETNTTKSAYGGQLLLYDLYIAKMFEVTYSDCQEIPKAGGRTWYYRAGNGKIDMGQFRINCLLASDIANTYG